MIRKREEYYSKGKKSTRNVRTEKKENVSSKRKNSTTEKEKMNKTSNRTNSKTSKKTTSKKSNRSSSRNNNRPNTRNSKTNTRNSNVNTQKRKVNNKPRTKKGKCFSSKKGALLAALALTAAASFLYAKSKEQEEYTRMGTAFEVEGDEYENSIPISIDGNVVATVEEGSILFIEGRKGKNINIKTISEDGEIVEGYTSKEYVNETGKIKTDELESYSYIYKVKDLEGHLTVRSEKSLDDESKMGKLYSEELILGKEPMIVDENGISWIQILYDDNGEFKNAYVSGDYVRIIGKVNGKEAEGNIITKQEEKELLDRLRVNENGQVIGIDISDGVSPEQLEELLTNPNAIPSKGYRDEYNEQTKETEQVEYNLDDLQGKIDYVILKIGARRYGENGNIVDYGNIYAEQAKVCEMYGIPYGFYFFSTALTYSEAEEEVEYFEKALEELGDSRKYNLIPPIIDSEPASGFRTYKEDLTEIIALELNELGKVDGKPMLYTMGPNIASNSPEKNIDIEKLNEHLEDGPVTLWLSSHRRTDNSDVYGPQYLKDVENQTTISMIQTANDIYNDQEGLSCKVDINMADQAEFRKIIKRRAAEMRGEAYIKEIEEKNINTFKGLMEGVSSELSVGMDELNNEVQKRVMQIEGYKKANEIKEGLKRVMPEITSKFFSEFVQDGSEYVNERKDER